MYMMTNIGLHVDWDSNPPPLDYEFKPITTRPPRPHVYMYTSFIKYTSDHKNNVHVPVKKTYHWTMNTITWHFNVI